MKKKTVYKGKPVSIDVYNLTIEGRKVRREIIQHPGAAAILAFDEKGRIILVSNIDFHTDMFWKFQLERWKKVRHLENVPFERLKKKLATKPKK